jgi:hypothetical protein
MRKIMIAVVALFAVRSAYAQEPLATVPPSHVFLPRFDFAISLASLASSDPRFSYDGRATADFDIVDYVKGRTSVFAQYQVIMGNQLRAFDPNQGNYTFEGSSSLRLHGTEVAGLFHHLSRHLSDRPNVQSIAFNAVGGRVLHHFNRGKTGIDIRADVDKVIQHAFLDYSWTAQMHAAARRSLSAKTAVFGRATFETYGVNPTIAQRSEQNGGRVEGGLLINGARAAIEMYAGWEQVVDAYPLERAIQRFSFIGFRLEAK